MASSSPHPIPRELLWIVFLPLSWIWAGLALLRRKGYPSYRRYRPLSRVVSIGNLHSGGSGKTPVAVEVCNRLRELNPVLLSRGYGGSLSRRSVGTRVDCTVRDGDRLFGDEPWMLAHRLACPVYVGKSRGQLARSIEGTGFRGIFVLDDGFQHLSIERDVELVCINVDRSPLQACCLPMGDLREPMSVLTHATAVLLVDGAGERGLLTWREFLSRNFPSLRHFEAKRVSLGVQPVAEGTRRLIGFCGIAMPERFRRDLHTLSDAVFLKAYSDHHSYTDGELDWLIHERRRLGADNLITTDKDWYKLKDRFSARGELLFALRIGYEISEEFWYLLRSGLGVA